MEDRDNDDGKKDDKSSKNKGEQTSSDDKKSKKKIKTKEKHDSAQGNQNSKDKMKKGKMKRSRRLSPLREQSSTHGDDFSDFSRDFSLSTSDQLPVQRDISPTLDCYISGDSCSSIWDSCSSSTDSLHTEDSFYFRMSGSSCSVYSFTTEESCESDNSLESRENARGYQRERAELMTVTSDQPDLAEYYIDPGTVNIGMIDDLGWF